MKKRIAVFFGGRSAEHDVSIVTGLQVFNALDTSLFDPFCVYIAPDGQWYIGDALKDSDNYIFDRDQIKQLTPVSLDLSATGKGKLIPQHKSLFGKNKNIEFDIALPSFHGQIGEDGNFQGLMELANIPYTGMRSKASAIFMDKDITKRALMNEGIPMLPHVCVYRPQKSLLIDEEELKPLVKQIGFPCIVKPANLGSSIGVGKANNIEEARELLSQLFRHDTKAILEPFVQNLVEYNVALRVNSNGDIETSVIERPKTSEELLDFKTKYMSSDGSKKTGQKNPGTLSQGLINLTRDLTPDLSKKKQEDIRQMAVTVFSAFGASGAPRIDFISDGKTGEIWFNELNPIPGSFGYFLWEPAETPVLFTDLLTDMINEAEYHHNRGQIPYDPVPNDARLFKRPLN